MNAKALICDERQHFALDDVILPDPATDQVAIRTHFTGVSIGTEFGLISGKISKLDRSRYPLCTGYQGTGVIEAVGNEIDNLAVGDEVYFRGNDAMSLPDGREVNLVSGGHCSRIVTCPNTTHGVAAMVPGAALDVASLFVMPAVGLYGVDMASPRMGDVVVVHGAVVLPVVLVLREVLVLPVVLTACAVLLVPHEAPVDPCGAGVAVRHADVAARNVGAAEENGLLEVRGGRV